MVFAAPSVRVLEANEFDWPEGRRALEAELTASGYVVERERSDARSEGELLEILRVRKDAGLLASVTVLRSGSTGVAHVHFAGSAETYSVASSELEPSRAAEVLSLRLVELLAVRGVERAPEPPRSKPAPLAPKPSERPWSAFLGGGPGWTSDFETPSFDLRLGLQRKLYGVLLLEARGRFSLAPSERTFPSGTVAVASRAGSVGVVANFGPRFPGASGPFVEPGLRLGVECFEIRGGESGTTTACAPAALLGARLGWRFEEWSLGVAGETSLALQQLRLLEGSAVLAVPGRPTGDLGLEAAWHF